MSEGYCNKNQIMMHKRKFLCQFSILLLCILLFVIIIYNYRSQNLLNSTEQQQTTMKSDYPKFFDCIDSPRKISIQERGDYMVYFNIIPAKRTFRCHDSITLTTISEYNYLDNVVTLVERWQGPISVAVYAPGDDFKTALDAIAYYRHCENDAVQDLVSFHIFHGTGHYPKLNSSVISLIQSHPALSGSSINCSTLKTTTRKPTSYRKQHALPFPVNTARNIARLAAETHYIFPSDIELYPSLNIIPNFFKMLENNHKLIKQSVVFAMPVFEVEADAQVPDTKNELLVMYNDRKAIMFHAGFCSSCHNIPRKKDWLSRRAKEDGTLNVFAMVKRKKDYKHWEPMYIGTQAEPLYDERIYWDGGSDKLVQSYALCLLDYDFVLLDNAFLVHKPGIKLKSSQKREFRDVSRKTMIEHIEPEMNTLYGKREGCFMYTKNFRN